MYETLGNADATAVVTRSVALLARIVAAHRGQVVKTLGDGLMAVFETPAESVAAADDMHDSLARIGMGEDSQSDAANDEQAEEEEAGGAPTLPPRPFTRWHDAQRPPPKNSVSPRAASPRDGVTGCCSVRRSRRCWARRCAIGMRSPHGPAAACAHTTPPTPSCA